MSNLYDHKIRHCLIFSQITGKRKSLFLFLYKNCSFDLVTIYYVYFLYIAYVHIHTYVYILDASNLLLACIYFFLPLLKVIFALIK